MSVSAGETGAVGMGAMVSSGPVLVLRPVVWMLAIVFMPMLAPCTRGILRSVVEGLHDGFVMHFAITKLAQDHLC